VSELQRIGFIGLGVMGKAMAHNIMKAGFGLTVHNRSRPKVDELVAAGAKAGGSAAGVAREAEVVFLCMPDTPDVEAVLFGEEGVAVGAAPGTVVVDCSTISATATVEFAKRLAERGIDLVDSPVSGGPQGALAGTLSCMIGGETAAVERAMPALRAIGQKFVHLGPAGSGQLVKACNQLVVAVTMMGVSEAVALCMKLGIDPHKMREALLGGAAKSFVLENHGRRLLEETLAPGFRSELMLKDMKLATQAGRDAGAFMPASALAANMLAALCAGGRGHMDNAALGLLFQELSGLRK
jgi:2-hydroxy-3-oxopropionate reductase